MFVCTVKLQCNILFMNVPFKWPYRHSFIFFVKHWKLSSMWLMVIVSSYSMYCETKFMISYREMLLNSWASVLNFLFVFFFLFMWVFYDAAKMILLYFMLKMLTGYNKLKVLFGWTLQKFFLMNLDFRVLSYLWMPNYILESFIPCSLETP